MEEVMTAAGAATGALALRGPRVIAVTSGKGGVGKTNVTANLALALARRGRRVLVLDADLGLGNVDVLRGDRRLADILVEGPGGIRILPACSGLQELTALREDQRLALRDELDEAAGEADVLLIDTGAGISANVLFFAGLAGDILVVASPEPTAMADAYALMKVLSRREVGRRFRLLVNLAASPREGLEVHRRLGLVADRFLDIAIEYVGAVPADDHVRLAVARQKAVVDLFPKAPASVAFDRLAAAVAGWPGAAPAAMRAAGRAGNE